MSLWRWQLSSGLPSKSLSLAQSRALRLAWERSVGWDKGRLPIHARQRALLMQHGHQGQRVEEEGWAPGHCLWGAGSHRLAPLPSSWVNRNYLD